ncbi:exodeoxyribonuclease V subunit beta [soil metagenome]
MLTTTRLDPRDPLPGPGDVTVLEASAGTGKTHEITGLVTRYVAQGIALPRLLVVTFTRSASAELRERVRTRLVAAADHLDGYLDGAAPSDPDDVLEHLCEGGRDEVAVRRRRLGDALAEFDAATIATIHGFCRHVLAGIGVAADVDRTAGLLEEPSGVVEAVVDDLFLRRFHGALAGDRRVSRRDLLAIARRVVANADAVIVPSDPEDPTAALRVELARAVRAEVDRRKRALGVLSYDDLLTRLEAALRDPDHGAAARRRLRAAYSVALIDEFQDTDPIQWAIVRQVFAHEGSGLLLIGDPKQAIYGFRGADVYAYLRAAETAPGRLTLDVNWRSDAGLLRAFNVLFAGASLGHRDITYRHADAAPPGQDPPRLVGAPVQAPLRLRVVRRGPGIRLVSGGSRVQADAARARVAADVASQIVALLESPARIVQRGTDGRERGSAPLGPGDLAVLVRTNAEAALVQRTLLDAGVPAVINGVGSVFATPAATDWLRLLEALERPTSPGRARTCALTAFLGWSAERVATASEDEWQQVHERLHRWAGVLRDASVASLLRIITVDQRLQRRLLARPDGERLLTDVQHVAELLHAAAGAEGLGSTTLAGWLRDRVAESEEDVTVEERARRLESDAAAVQVLTVHRSKGLEFSIVFCPYLWSRGHFDGTVPLFHDRDDRRRVVDVGGHDSPEFGDHCSDAKREQRGEDLRLLYVALTRARHQAVVWWVPATNSEESPLGRLLFCRSGGGDVNLRCDKASVPDDDVVLRRLGELAARADTAISVEGVPGEVAPVRWDGEPSAEHELAPARFDRVVDLRWRRTSYSALTAAAVERPVVASEPGEPFTDDERLPQAVAATGADDSGREARLRAVPSPLAGMPGGTEVGTAVHAVLETTDFTAADLPTEMGRRIAEQRARRDVALGDRDALVDGLRRVVETPLGPLVGDLRLRDVSRRDRRDELQFELPLAGGATPTADLRIGTVAELLRAYLGPGDPLHGYADRLADPALDRTLRGYLTGGIDLVLRLGGSRFVVVDHKTNWLGAPGEALSAWHYRPAALAGAMRHGHYPLQALLYSVALHRYLRWRLPGYDPARSLVGVLYLFVRGMTGADVPRVEGHPCGVFSWCPPSRLVTDLSDLLDSGRAAA